MADELVALPPGAADRTFALRSATLALNGG
jgi:hypothetical protein